jgi:hypothetical protein
MMNEGPLGENDEKMMREKARTSGFISDFTRCRNYMTGKELRKRGLMVTTIDDTPRNVGPYKLTREGSRLAAEIELHMG